MRLREYPKIAGAQAPAGRLGGGPWVATEKIHGAQLSITVAGGSVRFAKRRAWLDDGDAFFGWQLVRAELAEDALAVAGEVGAAVVVLYGELFGGRYPHPDVQEVPGLDPVQTGAWYAPDLRWAVFDILVVAGGDEDGELLAPSEVADLAAQAGLLSPPVLRAGRRADLDLVPERFPTKVPALLGLPPIDANLAEGLVLRRDARERPGERSAHKRKIEEFDEQRFDEARPRDTTVPPSAAVLRLWAERLTNPARVAGAISKWGTSDRAAVLDEIELDVLVDLEAAFPAAGALLDDRSVRDLVRSTAERLLDAPAG